MNSRSAVNAQRSQSCKECGASDVDYDLIATKVPTGKNFRFFLLGPSSRTAKSNPPKEQIFARVWDQGRRFPAIEIPPARASITENTSLVRECQKATLHPSLRRGDRPVMYAMRECPFRPSTYRPFIAIRGESSRVMVHHEKK